MRDDIAQLIIFLLNFYINSHKNLKAYIWEDKKV